MVKRGHRVVVVGGGFGGLPATEVLRKGDVEVTLIDRANHHLFQPLLVHLALLTGFRNRFAALMAWSWAFIGRSRNQRAFTVQSVGGSDIYRGFTRVGSQYPEGIS